MGYVGRMSTVDYEGVAEARAGFKDLLDAASAGKPVGVRRDQGRFLVVDADRMRQFLASVGPRPQIVAENDGWSLFFPGLPNRGQPQPQDPALPVEIAGLLVTKVRLTQSEVAAMTKHEAIARLNQFWAEGN